MVTVTQFSRITLALCFISMPFYSWASDDHGHYAQKSHVHGQAELALAVEGNMLEINLESPAANIVGFEHKASTSEQKKIVKNAKALLETPQTLFTFTGARCESKKVTVDVTAVMNTSEHNHGNHSEEAHHHDEKHDNHDAHSEIEAHFYFECNQALQLTSVSVMLFDHFPGIEKIKAMWISHNKQGAAELTAQSNNITLR